MQKVFESTSPRDFSGASETAGSSGAEGSMLSAEGLREDDGEMPR